MTLLSATLPMLAAEVRQLLMNLTPRLRASHKFTTSKALEDGTDWEEVEHVPRLFTIEWDSAAEPYTMGSATYSLKLTALISIWYPLRGWSMERLVDAEHIRDAMKGIAGAGGGASTVAAVSYRLIDPAGGASVEETEDGIWLVLPLVADVAATQA